jgi:peptidoglycan hydrolase-like protein with peptidoglycan-binding domain
VKEEQMSKWTSALTLTVAAAMVATTAFAQSSNKPGTSSPSTSPSSDKPSGAPSASPGASTTDPTKSTSDTMKSPSMKSDSMKADSMKAEKMSKGAANGGSREQVKAVQQALKDKGHDPGAVDGVMGPKTRGALKDFQKKEGMKDTGRIDQETMTKLGVEAKTSATSPAPGSASPSTSSPSASPGTSPSATPSPSGSGATDTKTQPGTTEKK